ncbi:phenylalanyl-tRNA synthetase beta chain [Treponema rectale]|uniref:phenylalanine--tRNA ligase n=1 Tax=Treponema rectale TaxID=744512 RepID=A0A840SH51_9SPIR|nr:phenylalanyl-tRNA synthetase beta chain [Treponema rectale]
MPKIEVNEKLFWNLLGTKYDWKTQTELFEKKLTFAKAELDEKPDESEPADKRVIKIELNDTNRPDLWSTGGVTRCLREHEGASHSDYSSFMSYKDNIKDTGSRYAVVDPALKDIRPFMVAFVISGKPIDDPMLVDIMQTQEKLAWNFGRKRKSLSMGVYRAAGLKWPVHYEAADPDTVSFVPLQDDKKQTLREIVENHPKGKDYGWILKDFNKYPVLRDDSGEIMSMAPIINSATLGQIEVGDSELMVELTGDNMENLMLAASIVACDFYDAGYKILPVKVHHEYETGFGKDVVTPYYFQQTTDARLSAINKKLGVNLSKEQVLKALELMGNKISVSEKDGDVVFTVSPAPYRNDFLHEVDVIEDVMIGHGLDNFEPVAPSDFTIGRLLPITLYSRKVKNIMSGLGYQEMIFNYLGSKKSYIDNMNVDSKDVIEIANPMSENYQFIRPSIIASLFEAEAQSGNAVYPHKIFEVGKVAFIEPSENTGTKTIQSLGFLTAANNANFNDAASEVSTLLYYLDHKYEVVETNDPRFIPGRQAGIMVNGKQAGIFGEIHPQVLENWQVTVPCVAGEIDLEYLMANEPKEHAAVKTTEAKAAPAAPAKAKEESADKVLSGEAAVEHFNKYIQLIVAKVTKIETNPQGDKLYIETLDDGSGTPRIIQSGLRPYLKEEEILGKNVIIAANLAPRKMKGVESHGMLLAADYEEDGKEKVELLTAPWAAPGTQVILEGESECEKPAKIDIDRFCKIDYRITEKHAQAAGKNLVAAGQPIVMEKTVNGEIS